MTTENNFLGADNNIFSDRIHDAARRGHLNAEPFVRLLEDVRQVTLGIAAILQMERNNDIQIYSDVAPATNEAAITRAEAPVNAAMMACLRELARVSSAMIGSRIEHLADWAEECGVLKSGTPARHAQDAG